MIRRATAVAIFVVTFCFSSVYAQDDFMFHFEIGHLVGTGNTVNIHRVPLTNTSTGEVFFKEIQLDFGVDLDGSIIVKSITAEDTVPLSNSASNFISGEYQDGAGVRYIVSTGGVTSNGRKSGSVVKIASAFNAFNANWMTGPVQGHPLVGNLPEAQDLPDGAIYGIVGEEGRGGFCEGGLMTAAQVGNNLVITAYHQDSCETTTFGVVNFTLIRVLDPQ